MLYVCEHCGLVDEWMDGDIRVWCSDCGGEITMKHLIAGSRIVRPGATHKGSAFFEVIETVPDKSTQ